MTVKARVLDNGQWSALVEAAFITQPAGLVINEFMADNATTIEDPDEPGEYPDWIEIYNPTRFGGYGGDVSDGRFRGTDEVQIAAGVSVRRTDIVCSGRMTTARREPAHQLRLACGRRADPAYGGDGTTVIDQIELGVRPRMSPMAVRPHGGTTWGQLAAPSPGIQNGALR
jgi:hypothetical protein